MRSDNIKKGMQRAPHRSLLRACGVTDAEMDKPFIGVANSFTDIVPGHIHLKQIANAVKIVRIFACLRLRPALLATSRIFIAAPS